MKTAANSSKFGLSNFVCGQFYPIKLRHTVLISNKASPLLQQQTDVIFAIIMH